MPLREGVDMGKRECEMLRSALASTRYEYPRPHPSRARRPRRQPAKNVSLYCLNVTPQEELDKLNVPRETVFVFRDRGTGRPTKKERRELDGLMDELYYDEE